MAPGPSQGLFLCLLLFNQLNKWLHLIVFNLLNFKHTPLCLIFIPLAYARFFFVLSAGSSSVFFSPFPPFPVVSLFPLIYACNWQDVSSESRHIFDK